VSEPSAPAMAEPGAMQGTPLDLDALPPLPEGMGPLNPQQHAAVTTTHGPLLILAGAGSGKTRVLTRRIAYLLHEGVDPEAILAVTFTNKAAGEMKERVAELVGARADKVWVNTFHSACVRILRTDAEALGYTRRFAIYDDDDQLRVIRQLCRDLGYDPKQVRPRDVLGAIDRYKNRMLTRDDVLREQRARTGDPVMRVWERYEDALLTADALDFNDLIGTTVRLFEEHDEVLQRWRERFQFVLVDEYQDTNRAQYRLLRALTAQHRNLAVVGDDDQSIYGFRGADISNILDFERDFHDATIIRMEQNYRCSKHILALSNAVVAKADQRILKTLWTDRPGGAKVRFLSFDDARAEARAVATMVSRLAEEEQRPWEDFAVIYRTNAMSQPFERAFAEAGIPAKVVGGRKFYARREIRDALAYLRLLAHPADDAALLRIINVPARGIGAVTIRELRDRAAERGDALLKTARALASGTGRAAKALTAFVELIDGLMEAAVQASLPELVRETLVRSGYLAMLEEDGGKEAEGRRENLETLLRDAAAFVPEEEHVLSPMDRLGAWLDAIALTGADEEIPDGGQVVLTTVHSAKGLEYPVVFVVHMAEGRFPHQRALEDAGGVDEERRLAYVAFTRAKQRLYVTRIRTQVDVYARRDRRRGPTPPPTPLAPSRFLYGAPQESCEGDLPEVETRRPRVADRISRHRDAVAEARADLQRFLGREALLPAGVGPDDATPSSQGEDPHATPPREAEMHEEIHRTRTVTSAEDLQPGTRVVHERHGVGRIEAVVLPRILVEFGRGCITLRLPDPDLALLVD